MDAASRSGDDVATVTLFRPVGPTELSLIAESQWSAFPPRLSWQPFFYPVTNQAYAEQIARSWNVRDSGAGFVTRFHVRADFLRQFDVQTVGSSTHREYWIPAEVLPDFNDALVGQIEVVAEFHRDGVGAGDHIAST